ncbi:MAG: DUF924 domain-containing protein [Silicimonas sp.]|nr:DUF924 domain-containing protein [Silicimonas sp.]
MTGPEDVLRFWLDEVGPKGWYSGGDDLDRTLREKFGSLHDRALEGALSLWLTYPSGTLAYIILTDQFSRNMFRGTAKAFGSDAIAKAAAKVAISRNWDMRIDEPARQFFYVPLMHSECLEDQDRAVRLFKTRMPETGDGMLPHARAHREVIRLYGRFPTRNEELNRRTSKDEQSYLDDGGYGAVLRRLQAETAA